MAIIRPITDLRNRSNEISELCKQENEPVFITRNGRGELVVMSQERYDEMEKRMKLYAEFGVAEAEERTGSKGIPLRAAVARLRRHIRGRKR
jgi:prevent-host-death family protein